VAESSADGGDAPGGSDPNLVRQRNLVIVDKNAAAEAAKAEEAAARWVWVGVWRGVESVCEEEEEEEEETVLVHAVKGDRRQSRRWATVRSRVSRALPGVRLPLQSGQSVTANAGECLVYRADHSDVSQVSLS
jgi:hypothetical protein